MELKKKNVSRILLVFICVGVLFLIGVNWFYPYSFISINKSISYNADNVVVKQYQKDLKDFKNSYYKELSKVPKDNLTIQQTQFIIQMYDQPWLTSTKPIQMKYQELDTILFEVKEARRILTELAIQETYSKDAKGFLKLTLENCSLIEENLEEIIDSKSHSRSNLNSQLHILHMSFMSNFDIFKSFYEYKKE